MATPPDRASRIDQFHALAASIGELPTGQLAASGLEPARALTRGQLSLLQRAAAEVDGSTPVRGPIVHMAYGLARRGLGEVVVALHARTRFAISDAGRAAARESS